MNIADTIPKYIIRTTISTIVVINGPDTTAPSIFLLSAIIGIHTPSILPIKIEIINVNDVIVAINAYQPTNSGVNAEKLSDGTIKITKIQISQILTNDTNAATDPR